jgi:hypothetical protein
MIISWWLAWKFEDPFISDWDGFDYTVGVVRGLPSALGLGRALFIGYNHLIWRVLHTLHLIHHEEAYLILRYGSILLSGPAVAGIYALTHELTRSRLAGLFAGMLLALSPYYVIYSGRSMSEIPGLCLLSWSLWFLVRSLPRRHPGLIMLAAVLIGLSANVREIAVFYLPFIPLAILLSGHRWRLASASMFLAILAALSGMAFWILRRGFLYWNEVATWYRLSAAERRLYPVTIRNFSLFSDYAYECSVAIVILVPLVFALLWPRRERRTLLVLGDVGVACRSGHAYQSRSLGQSALSVDRHGWTGAGLWLGAGRALSSRTMADGVADQWSGYPDDGQLCPDLSISLLAGPSRARGGRLPRADPHFSLEFRLHRWGAVATGQLLCRNRSPTILENNLSRIRMARR